MKKKIQRKSKVFVLHLTCQECGNKFTSERYRKYCTYKCQRAANNRYAKIRYGKMREVVLKAKGVIK